MGSEKHMKHLMNKALLLLSGALLLASCGPSTGMKAMPLEETKAPAGVLNGGFESSNLDGWTVEWGDAFSDDSVSSVKTFSYDYDENHTEIPVMQTGNWYLSGKGFDGRHTFRRTGAIRSQKFTLDGDGSVSLKIAGAAVRRGKGEAPFKDDAHLCYVGIYTADNDRMVARITNEYFLEHTEDFVDVKKYEKNVYNTDNFTEYSVALDDYLGKEMYIRVVDNDQDIYYGYISVDDIRVGGGEAQPEGSYYAKSHDYLDDIEAPSIYEIKNGGFETGSLAGWEVLEGLAFSHEGVNPESTWWNECITYDRDGDFHYGHYLPAATGRMRSSEFILGGSGYVSFKLGGCQNNDLTYLSFFVKDGDEAIEVARYSNRKYWNFQFPFFANGMKLLNMIQYVADLTPYIGKTMYIEAVDHNASADDLGAMTIDSIQTYHATKPGFYNVDHYQAISMISPEVEIESEYQVLNGTFETGDLTGWEKSWTNEDDRIGYVSDAYGWWDENYPYNKKGNYLFTGVSDEGNTGYLKSSSFTVGGINKMSFRMGGGRDPRLCYVGVYDATTNEELARYANRDFHDGDLALINKGINLLNMVQYVADLSAFEGKEVYLKVVDNATSAWGLIAVDSFITYYEDEASLPEGKPARNILPKEAIGEVDGAQVLNGDFETGDLTGWTLSNNIGDIGFSDAWWDEWYSYDHEGDYFFSGWNGNERSMGTLTSSPFVLSGQGYLSFRLGGGKNPEKCRVEIVDAETGEIYTTYVNYMFHQFEEPPLHRYYYNGAPIDIAQDGYHMANMVQYIGKVDIAIGKKVVIRLVDEAEDDWGLLFADSFITYYEGKEDLPKGYVAWNSPVSSGYQEYLH